MALSNLNLEIHQGDCFGFIGAQRRRQDHDHQDPRHGLLQPTWGEARVCDYVIGYQSRSIRPLIRLCAGLFRRL